MLDNVPVHQACKPFIPRSDLVFWLVVVGVAGSVSCKGRYWHCCEIDCCTLQALQPKAMNKEHTVYHLFDSSFKCLSQGQIADPVSSRDDVGDLKNSNWKVLKVLIFVPLRTKSWCESVSVCPDHWCKDMIDWLLAKHFSVRCAACWIRCTLWWLRSSTSQPSTSCGLPTPCGLTWTSFSLLHGECCCWLGLWCMVLVMTETVTARICGTIAVLNTCMTH